MRTLVALVVLSAVALPLLPSPAAAEEAPPPPLPTAGDRARWTSTGPDHAREETQRWITPQQAAEEDARLAPHVADGQIGRVLEGTRTTTNTGAYFKEETWKEVGLVRTADHHLVVEATTRTTVTQADQSFVSSNIVTYQDCPVILWPLVVGAERSYTCEGSGTSANGGTFSTESPSTLKVIAQESVTAGPTTFSAYKLEKHYESGGLGQTAWWSPETCGVVRDVVPFAPGADHDNQLQEATCAATGAAFVRDPPNRVPTITCSYKLHNDDAVVVSWTAADPDGDAVLVTIDIEPYAGHPHAAEDLVNQPATGTDVRIYAVDLDGEVNGRVTDGRGGEATAGCGEIPNHAPSLTCAVDVSDAGYTLRWHASDPDGDAIHTEAIAASGHVIAGLAASGTRVLPADWGGQAVSMRAFDVLAHRADATCAKDQDTHTLRVEITAPADGASLPRGEIVVQWAAHDILEDLDQVACEVAALEISPFGQRMRGANLHSSERDGLVPLSGSCTIPAPPPEVNAVEVTVSAWHAGDEVDESEVITLFFGAVCAPDGCAAECAPETTPQCAATLPGPAAPVVAGEVARIQLLGEEFGAGATGCRLAVVGEDGEVLTDEETPCRGLIDWRAGEDISERSIRLRLSGEIAGFPFTTLSESFTVHHLLNVDILSPAAGTTLERDGVVEYTVVDAAGDVTRVDCDVTAMVDGPEETLLVGRPLGRGTDDGADAPLTAAPRGCNLNLAALPADVHTVRVVVTATDALGRTASDEVTFGVRAPILAGQSTAAEGATVAFEVQEGALAGATGCRLVLRAPDGTILAEKTVDPCAGGAAVAVPGGTAGGSFVAELTGTIDGAAFAVASGTVNVVANTPPRVTIRSPSDGDRFGYDASRIELDYEAVDAEDKVPPATVVEWSQTPDGPWAKTLGDTFAGGANVSLLTEGGDAKPANQGEWFIRVTATDSGGLTGSDTVHVVVDIKKPSDLMDAFLSLFDKFAPAGGLFATLAAFAVAGALAGARRR